MIASLLPVLAMLQETPYHEPLRPQFHFTARSGWLNDPNGLSYFKGEYHLFFQYNPASTQDGNKHWGHAVSKDLVHWKELEVAIAPDELGDIWSGSAVVQDGKLVCIYTAAGGVNAASKGKPFTQCLSSSADGRTFTKFAGNPVLGHVEGGNRDPKVIWHEPTKRWILALFLDGSRYGLFSSTDLTSWSRLSSVELPGASECPDFFPLALDGDKAKTKWVFWGGSGNYFVGSFDGTAFHPETESIRSNFGNTGYAAQTFYNDPRGRRVQISWHNGSTFPGAPWNQELGFPTELRLVSTAAGPRLTFRPVDEIKKLRVWRVDPPYDVASGLMDIFLQIRPSSSGQLALAANGHEIHFDATNWTLSALDKSVKLEPLKGLLKLRILADRASIEVFAQDGLVSMPLFALPISDAKHGLRIEAPDDWKVEKSEVWELKSSWQP